MVQMQRVLPDFQLAEIRSACDNRDHCEYTRLVRRAFQFYCQTNLGPMQPSTRDHLESFLETFLDTFVSGNFILQVEAEDFFVSLNPIIANLLAMSKFKTADNWIAKLVDRGQNLAKFMTLVSPRSYRQIQQSDFPHVPKEHRLWSFWWEVYTKCTGSVISERVRQNLQTHFHRGPLPGFPRSTQFADSHFVPTYADEAGAPAVKSRMNEFIKLQWPQMLVNNTPDPTRIAIISDRWAPNTVVHRSVAPLVNALKGRFKLDLIHLGKDAGSLKLDTDGFDNVYFVYADAADCIQGLQPLLYNSYGAILYPDVGMNSLSVVLANQRFAPVQVSTTGHPVSTAGAEIDYFISGAEVETPDASQHYSERLVLLPGTGNQSTRPDYIPRNPAKKDEIVRINACWGPTKYNRPMLDAVQIGMQAAKTKCRVHFLPSNGICRYQGLNPFLAEIHEIFGDTAIVIPDRGGYDGYMHRLEAGDFGIDSHPFGGYNTIIDNWHLRKPMVTFRGQHWYSRVSSAINDRLGMSELVATNYQEYSDLITRMIDDGDFRNRMVDQITDTALNREIYENTEEPAAFCLAFQYLIDQYPEPHPAGLPINIGVPV